MNLKTINLFSLYRGKVAVQATLAGLFATTCYKAYGWKNDVLRFGVIGSLASVMMDATFHVADTINIRSKASVKSVPTSHMVQKIL
jgi:hypothetical protein